MITAALLFLPLAAHAFDADRADAGGCTAEDTPRLRGGTLRVENDLIANTDHNYTNGVGLSLVSHDLRGPPRPECLPPPIRLHARFIKAMNPKFWTDADHADTTWNVVTRFGQSMYTPEDHTRSDLIVDDRPYAGLLYAGMSWNRRSHRPDAGYEVLDTRELTLGIIGPWSLAEQAQNLIHDLRNSDRFHGWDHQLHNEPALQIAMERKFRPWAGAGAIQPGWSSDVIGRYALRLGNIETAAVTALVLRAGWNIPNDFGSYPISPGAESRPPSAAAGLRAQHPQSGRAPRPGVHAFVNFEAKAVAWDFSLDGNLFRSSHSVRRRPWVAQVATGISSQWLVRGRGVRLALMRVWRTREFDGQSDDHVFGSLAISIEL